jgi:hypothetical protein
MIMGNVSARDELAKYEAENQHHKERVQKAPQDPQNGVAIPYLQVSLYQILQKIPIPDDLFNR